LLESHALCVVVRRLSNEGGGPRGGRLIIRSPDVRLGPLEGDVVVSLAVLDLLLWDDLLRPKSLPQLFWVLVVGELEEALNFR
jgi:hypothetical protein